MMISNSHVFNQQNILAEILVGIDLTLDSNAAAQAIITGHVGRKVQNQKEF